MDISVNISAIRALMRKAHETTSADGAIRLVLADKNQRQNLTESTLKGVLGMSVADALGLQDKEPAR